MEERAVIVIGSGPSGAMAAYRLVHQGIPVILLESGLHSPDGLLVRMFGRNVFRKADSHGYEERKRHIASADTHALWYANLSPGGLSNQWTGAVPRFAPEDFHEGERLHECYRWPVSYAELIPYYEEAERLLCVTGEPADLPNLPAGKYAYHSHLPADWQRIRAFAQAHGQGLISVPLADGSPWMIARRATAFNSFTNIVHQLQRSPHFKLLMGVHVLRLEWSSTLQRVSGVVYVRRADGSQQRLPAAAVVVACGPLQSTRLLFNSACADFPDGLGNAQGLLGRYLHDHPRQWWAFEVDRPLSRLPHAAYLTRLPHAASEPLLACSWTIGHASQNDRLLSLTPLKTNAFGVQVFGTTIPNEQNFVRPDPQEKDEFGLPLLNLHIRFSEAVLANMQQARDRLLNLMTEAGYRADLRKEPQPLIPGTAVHYGGTIRMHNSRKYGMLDACNRLYDVPNVVVTDASCFTTGPEKNPTLTMMAIAARAMDHLAADLKRSP